MVILAGGLILLLAVVIIRADTTRLHYATSQCERRAEELRQRALEGELELARLRNPLRIRQRMEQAVGELLEQTPAPKKSPSKPPPKLPPKPRPTGR